MIKWKLILWVVCLAGGCVVFICTTSLAAAREYVEYHVATNGNNGNAGSAAAPFRTVGKAASMALPGDTVIVHGGTYREWVQPARGGTSDSVRITYKAADGEKVVLKGSEEINSWEKLGDGMWKVDLDDSYFVTNNWYPFRDTVLGKDEIGKKWLGVGRWCHKGEVFLNEEWLYEKETLEECRKKEGTWFTSREGSTQSIYANFGQKDPNAELAEITVRQSVFGTDVQSGIDYITVDGFTMMQSSEEWLPTYAKPNSRGVLFTSGTGWIVQNCTVLLAKMRGVVTDHGSNHVIRNNTIYKCGSAGIGGADTADVVISGNWIYEIHQEQSYTGAEHAGIKYHSSTNMIISGNIISDVYALEDYGDKGMGIWMDWPKGNNRITGNVVVDCTGRGLMIENPFGAHLMDNNIIINNLWPSHFESAAVLVNNLFHSTGLWFRNGWWGRCRNESNRVFNNILFVNTTNLAANADNQVDYNSYMDGAHTNSFGDVHSVEDSVAPQFSYVIDHTNRTVAVTFTVGEKTAGLECPLVTTESVGEMVCGKKDMEKTTTEYIVSIMTNPDVSSFVVDRDFFQNPRGPVTKVGPFCGITNGVNRFVLKPNSDFDYRVQGPVTGLDVLKKEQRTDI